MAGQADDLLKVGNLLEVRSGTAVRLGPEASNRKVKTSRSPLGWLTGHGWPGRPNGGPLKTPSARQ